MADDELIKAVNQCLDFLRGGGEYSISVPPFDGALRPNERIEEGRIVASVQAPDNLVLAATGVHFSSGRKLLRLAVAAGENDRAEPVEVQELTSQITAIAACGDGLAVGLEGGGVSIVGGAQRGRTFAELERTPLNCPTALAFADPATLYVANGSSRHAPSKWKHDLLESGASGTVWRVDLPSGRATQLADGLAYPYGLLPTPAGGLLLSESWRHRLILIAAGGSHATVLQNLAAYPSRISTCADGGAWVAMFAPRRRLIEFVLREPAYRRRMMTEIGSDYWIAPTLAPMSSFLEPLQGGTLKKLARLKPWAPTPSYGLIMRIDDRFQPVDSLHSRADGTRHGIRSVLETPGGLLAASAGANAIVAISRNEAA